MRDEILSYWEMCARERMSLQRGMNFREPPDVSIVLMNQRPGAPYNDSLSEDGRELIYEGHDVARTAGVADPKAVDQPWYLPTGSSTENARFARAAERYPTQRCLVRAYEKLRQGIWSDKGLFDLVGYAYSPSDGRKVFKFQMRLSDVPDEFDQRPATGDFRRAIPSWVKQAVYQRDKGRCVVCGAEDQLHFDHDLPYSKGGTGLTPHNVRILCARHNLEKGAKIE